MATVISFTDDGNSYELEYTRETVSQVSDMGLDLTNIGKNLVKQPELLFYGAFLAHHKKVKLPMARRMFNNLPDSETQNELVKMLIEMVDNAISTLGGTGNATWQVKKEAKTTK